MKIQAESLFYHWNRSSVRSRLAVRRCRGSSLLINALPSSIALCLLTRVCVDSVFLFLRHPFVSSMARRGGSHFGGSLDSSSPESSAARGNDETQRSASSAAEVEFPFSILFREALESNSEDGRPPLWIDPGVMEVHSTYTRSGSLVGMANAICSWGPWEVRVLPCQSNEVICSWVNERGEPYFYFYETMFSKLGIRLSFSNFEWVVLRALNVAPTQLHPNNWAFVRAFELLCEDMGREPSLSVFFWYFSLRQVDKRFKDNEVNEVVL
ncbi:hypothetical protein CR513_49399, partial [Mucuna pruriens]